MEETTYIPDVFESIVEQTSASVLAKLQLIQPAIIGVHFMTGHYTEIRNRLDAKNSAVSTAAKSKYPLIALFMDFVESKANDGLYATLSLQLMIVHHTKKEDYVEDRRDKVFKPILYPIYTEFLQQIVNCGRFQLYTKDDIIHKKIDRPHWGNEAQYGPEGYILGDVLDGVEIKDLQLKMFKPNCN